MEDLGQLVVVEHGQLEVPRDDPGLLVVPGSVAGQLEDLGGEVLQHLDLILIGRHRFGPNGE